MNAPSTSYTLLKDPNDSHAWRSCRPDEDEEDYSSNICSETTPLRGASDSYLYTPEHQLLDLEHTSIHAESSESNFLNRQQKSRLWRKQRSNQIVDNAISNASNRETSEQKKRSLNEIQSVAEELSDSNPPQYDLVCGSVKTGQKSIDDDIVEEARENWRLVNHDQPSNWLNCVRNLSRPSSVGVLGSSQDQDDFRTDQFPEISLRNLSTTKRPRKGSCWNFDGQMLGNSCNPRGYNAQRSTGGARGRKTSLFNYGTRSQQTQLIRRQSAVAAPHRLPPIHFGQSHLPEMDRRKQSTISLATTALYPAGRQQRSPSQQWPMNRNSTSSVMPLVPVPDCHGSAPGTGTSTTGHPAPEGNDHRAGSHNPLYDVSNEFMRVTGYTQQFKRLLSKRSNPWPKRQTSAPSAPIGFEPSGKSEKAMTGRGSSEFHEAATLTAAVALGGRRPPSPTDVIDGNGTVVGDVVAVKLGKQRSAYGRLWKEHPDIKHRLRQRKHLFYQRIKVSDFSLLFALAGIALTILEAELSSVGAIRKTEYPSLLLRSLVVATTLVLLGLIVCYHAIETKISVIDSGAEDWRVAITHERIWQCVLEVLICSVCPFPAGNTSVSWDRIAANDHRSTRPISVPLDAVLSVPMFLRAYLICRFMALHSRQFQDAATRSIAALNHIAVNFAFVLKTLMHEHPLRVLILFTVTFWIAMSWVLTQCERYKGDNEKSEDNHYLNSVWFIIITFMSIGYGDIVPNTYCGRALAITTGIVGAGVSSALIAVISRKLELSRAEKHVNQFMTDSKLTRQRKEAAASVLQHTWFIHKYKNIPKEKDDTKLRMHQRKFLSAITEFRRVKWDQRKLAEQGNALVDVAKLQNDMHETLWDMQQNQDHLVSQLGVLMTKVQELQDTILAQCVQTANTVQSVPVQSMPTSLRRISNVTPGQLLQQPIAAPLPTLVRPAVPDDDNENV